MAWVQAAALSVAWGRGGRPGEEVKALGMRGKAWGRDEWWLDK